MAIDPKAVIAYELGRFYKGVAFKISEYVYNNIVSIPKEQLTGIFDNETRISTYANTFFSLAQNLVFSDLSQIKKIGDATDEVNKALDKIDDINKVISISAGVITLAGAILTDDPKGIATSVSTVINAAKSKSKS